MMPWTLVGLIEARVARGGLEHLIAVALQTRPQQAAHLNFIVNHQYGPDAGGLIHNSASVPFAARGWNAIPGSTSGAATGTTWPKGRLIVKSAPDRKSVVEGKSAD